MRAHNDVAVLNAAGIRCVGLAGGERTPDPPRERVQG
jgi:hypothetical protein